MAIHESYRIPVIIAVALHLLLVVILVAGYSFDWIKPTGGKGQPVINAVAISGNPGAKRPPRTTPPKQQPKPEPAKPDPQIEERERQQELERQRAAREQEQQRQAEAERQQREEAQRKEKVEQERKARIDAEKKRQAQKEKELAEEKERQRQQEEEQKRKAEEDRKKAEAEKKRKEEEQKKKAEEDRKKAEAEKKRKAEEERKRREEAAQRAADEELERLLGDENALAEQRAMASAADAATQAIMEKVRRNWTRPDAPGQCEFTVRLAPGGLITSLSQGSGDRAYCSSGYAAIKSSEPLPVPNDPRVFNSIKELKLILKPEN